MPSEQTALHIHADGPQICHLPAENDSCPSIGSDRRSRQSPRSTHTTPSDLSALVHPSRENTAESDSANTCQSDAANVALAKLPQPLATRLTHAVERSCCKVQQLRHCITRFSQWCRDELVVRQHFDPIQPHINRRVACCAAAISLLLPGCLAVQQPRSGYGSAVQVSSAQTDRVW